MIAKSAILVDFDNVFLTLWDLDRDAAFRFASEPGYWLQVLANSHLASDARRWLVAKCYLNPAGYVHAPGRGGDRLFFTRFRPALMRAGFEVIDCPAVARGGKNAAYIRMVIDALDLLGHATRFDEVVLASGDSDFTPLLQRLRANDRLVTVLSPGYLSAVYTALADKVIGFDDIRGLLGPEADEPVDLNDVAEVRRIADVPAEASADLGQGAFGEFIQQQYEAANSPLNLAALALAAARACPSAKQSQWHGHGSFSAAVAAIGLRRARFSQHHLWDEERHQAPVTATPGEGPRLPEPIEQLSRSLDLPRIERENWPRLFDALESYAASHEFNLTDATRWCRDALAAEGVQVSRNAVGYVARSCQFGGAKLDSESKTSAAQIGAAFLAAVLDRAIALGVQLDAGVESDIADWLGVPLSPTGSI